MNAVRTYLVSVVAACMIAAIGSVFVRNHMSARVLRLISGVLILLVAVSPLLKIRSRDISEFFSAEGISDFSAETENIKVQEALAEQIRKSAEKHIESIASGMGMTVQARVTVSREKIPKPVSVELVCTAEPGKVKELSDYIATGLGIPAEKQEWRLYETDG